MKRVEVIENHLQFRSPLSVRQKTDRIILHWIGTIPANLNPDLIDVDMINDWHIDRKFSGIAYHYLITRAGGVERGRPRWAQGAHDAGENSRSIGICIVSGFGLPPNADQMESLDKLLADLCDTYSLSANDETIKGHRDDEPPETPTECPGDLIYKMLPAIREQVRALRGY